MCYAFCCAKMFAIEARNEHAQNMQPYIICQHVHYASGCAKMFAIGA